MDELVMMRSVGVGAGSAGASIISSVRSLPEKPRRTGKTKCVELFVCLCEIRMKIVFYNLEFLKMFEFGATRFDFLR